MAGGLKKDKGICEKGRIPEEEGSAFLLSDKALEKTVKLQYN